MVAACLCKLVRTQTYATTVFLPPCPISFGEGGGEKFLKNAGNVGFIAAHPVSSPDAHREKHVGSDRENRAIY
jgi:hypothetical protein